MKTSALLLLPLLASPYLQGAGALFFGVNIQDGSGTTIAGADATQTGAIFGLGFLGAALALLKADRFNRGRREVSEEVPSMVSF